ncbi:hypothetical protein [Chryseobacterium sp. Marseille-Q3244]|uniref:hypothetical protein n=1 Tax=Chryseobacterium sp. Marseille-Q3244 TaxID=2758092 RepID=UPI00202416EA|nr:hypothetical protein [Chryseobacterium sp. Marseille-Q3244]
MDRNYILSYGQIAFLLLLLTIGKLNARIISATMGMSELLHCTDKKDTELYPHLYDAFSQEPLSSVKCRPLHVKINADSQPIFLEHSLQSNLPMVNDRNFFLLPIKNLKSISVEYKWRIFNAAVHTEGLSIVEHIKNFYINSVKLIDGFKFIIKIPDKLNTDL